MESLVPLALVVVAMVVVFFPELKALTGGAWLESGIEGGPDDFDRDWDEYLEFAPRFKEMEALGFQRRGICWERLGWLGGREFIFADPARRTHGIVVKLRGHSKNSLPGVTFKTAFTNAALVITYDLIDLGPQTDLPHLRQGGMPAFPPPAVPVAGAGGWRRHAGIMMLHLVGWLVLGAGTVYATGWDTMWTLGVAALGVLVMMTQRRGTDPKQPLRAQFTLADVLAEHEARVARFVAQGYMPVADDSLEGYCAVDELSRRYHPWSPYIFLAVKLGVVLAIPVVLACVLGWAHTGVWIAWSLQAVLLVAVRFWLGFRPRTGPARE